MTVMQTLISIGAAASGIVSVIVLVSAVADVVTRGWVRDSVQQWLGIVALRQQHELVRVFLSDLGDSHNELSQTVCDQHDIDPDARPAEIDVDQFDRIVDDKRVEEGDFLKGDDD